MTKDNSQTVAGSTSVSLDSGNNNSSNSDFSFHEDQNDGDDGMDDDDDVSNYDDDDDDNGYMFYDNDDDDECDYLSMQAQFDNVDLPAGVEATVSWLNEPAPSSKAPSQVSSSSHLVGVGTVKPTLPENGRSSNLSQVPASSSSLVSVESSSRGKEEAAEEEAMKKYQSFKHFDVVDDFSDHHYSSLGFQGQQVTCKGISFALQIILWHFSWSFYSTMLTSAVTFLTAT